jgi:hypothetical protein
MNSFTRSLSSKLEGETADVTKREVEKILEERKDAGVPVAAEDKTVVMEVDFGAPEAGNVLLPRLKVRSETVTEPERDKAVVRFYG